MSIEHSDDCWDQRGKYNPAVRCHGECLSKSIYRRVNVQKDDLVAKLERKVELMQPIVDEYLRNAANHKRHKEAGGFLSLGDSTMVDKAREYKEKLDGL